MVYLHQRLHTQGKPGAAFGPKDEAANSHKHVNEKLPVTGHAIIISSIFFLPSHPSKSKRGNKLGQWLRQSGSPACGFLKRLGCFFFCWVTPTGGGGEEGFQEELGLRLRLNVELMGSGEVQGRPQSLQSKEESRNGQTHSRLCFIGVGDDDTTLFWPLEDTGTHH